jgi:hypothetical protein
VAILEIRSEIFLEMLAGFGVLRRVPVLKDHGYQTPKVKQVNDFVHYLIYKMTFPIPCKAGGLVSKV